MKLNLNFLYHFVFINMFLFSLYLIDVLYGIFSTLSSNLSIVMCIYILFQTKVLILSISLLLICVCIIYIKTREANDLFLVSLLLSNEFNILNSVLLENEDLSEFQWEVELFIIKYRLWFNLSNYYFNSFFKYLNELSFKVI